MTPPLEVAYYLDRYSYRSKKVIFVSLPSTVNKPGKSEGLRKHIADAVQACGCVLFDGFSNPSSVESGRADEIFARMWRADAGIFLAPDEDEINWLTANQEIEWGFMRPICSKTVIVSSAKSATSKRRFMMPDELMITYPALEDISDYRKVRDDVVEKIAKWFPKLAK